MPIRSRFEGSHREGHDQYSFGEAPPGLRSVRQFGDILALEHIVNGVFCKSMLPRSEHPSRYAKDVLAHAGQRTSTCVMTKSFHVNVTPSSCSNWSYVVLKAQYCYISRSCWPGTFCRLNTDSPNCKGVWVALYYVSTPPMTTLLPCLMFWRRVSVQS